MQYHYHKQRVALKWQWRGCYNQPHCGSGTVRKPRSARFQRPLPRPTTTTTAPLPPLQTQQHHCHSNNVAHARLTANDAPAPQLPLPRGPTTTVRTARIPSFDWYHCHRATATRCFTMCHSVPLLTTPPFFFLFFFLVSKAPFSIHHNSANTATTTF
jgi:hypothetical protein